MSFDLFVCPLPGVVWGESERLRIIEILHRDGVTDDPHWVVRYAERDGISDMSDLNDFDEGGMSTGLCFHRFGGRIFADRLYELADRLDAMVFWPDVDPPFIVVTRPELFDRLPRDLKPGMAAVVRDAGELMAQICK